MNKEKRDIAKEITKKLNELDQIKEIERMVKDNYIQFTHKEKIYRIRKPTWAEQEETNRIKNKRYLELMEDDGYKFREQWIKLYKKKGINIEGMNVELNNKQKKVTEIMLKLAKEKDDNSINILKREIYKIREEMAEITIRVTDLLSGSIEDTLTIFVNSYVCYLVLEKQTPLGELTAKGDTKWERVYNDYNEFADSENLSLINKALYYLNFLIYNNEEITK